MRREWLLPAALGCSGGADPSTSEPAPECAARVELGTGTTAFAPLAEGAGLAMVHGPQGGYHLPLAVRGCRVGQTAEMHFVGTLDAGDVVVDVLLDYPWMPLDACCSVALDIYGYLSSPDSGSTPPDLAGEGLRLRLDAADASGVALADEVHVVVLGPE